MGAILILFVLGMAVGAGTGSAAGAFVGGLIGALLALAGLGLGWLRNHVRDVDPIVEDHSVMCFRYAQAADCSFVADRNRGKWIDVAWCSHQPRGVACDKTCLPLLNIARVRPGAA
jgi:hypothetical protein